MASAENDSVGQFVDTSAISPRKDIDGPVLLPEDLVLKHELHHELPSEVSVEPQVVKDASNKSADDEQFEGTFDGACEATGKMISSVVNDEVDISAGSLMQNMKDNIDGFSNPQEIQQVLRPCVAGRNASLNRPANWSVRSCDAETGKPSRNHDRCREHDHDVDARSDTDSRYSSDDNYSSSGRRGYRHRHRAGRLVRERRLGKSRQNVKSMRSVRREFNSFLLCLKDVVRSSLPSMQMNGAIMHISRFGLFCLMAWSFNSILTSIMQMCCTDGATH